MKEPHLTARYLGPVETVLLLKSAPQLAGLSVDELAGMAANAVERRHKKGSSLFTPTDGYPDLLVLIEGHATLSLNGTMVGSVGPGSPIGIESIVLDNWETDAVATEHSSTIGINGDVIRDLFESNASMWSELLRAYGEARLRHAAAILSSRPTLHTPLTHDMGIAQRLRILAHRQCLGSKDLDAVIDLTTTAAIVHLEPGDTLFHIGDAPEHVWIITEGTVEVSGPGLGHAPIEVSGGPIGFDEACANKRHAARAVAITRVHLFSLPWASVRATLEDHVDLARAWLDVAVRQSLPFPRTSPWKLPTIQS